MKIAIHQNKEIFNHTSSWDRVWIEYCEKESINYEVVNCFDNGILEKLKNFDILLWHFSHYSHQEMNFARNILYSASQMGIITFPNYETSWHFDDKIAQSYLLTSIDAAIPKSWTFYTLNSALDFFKDDCVFPIVAKLKSGSGSHNVKLLRNKKEAETYAKHMFGKGVNPTPSLLYKTKSNVQTSKNIQTFINRFKRIPDFVESLKKSRSFDNEKGYVYLQEFIPNDGYDLKVVVVDEKLSFVARDVRQGDFRASGGGSINYNKELLTTDIKKIAFKTSKLLNFQCMGYDFVVDKRTNEPKIIEISYGFSHLAQIELKGHWTETDNWSEQPLNAPLTVINALIEERKERVV